MIKIDRLIVFAILCYTLSGCATKLTFTEIKDKINASYTAHFEGDVEYMIKHTPKKYVEEYGENGLRKKLLKIFNDKRENPPYYNDIGDLKIQDRNKCNSTIFYKVKYLLDKSEFTPYLDSTALELNYKEYGKENVSFLPNVKILQIRMTKEEILILDKDRIWKLLNYDSNMEYLNRYFGNGFSECIHSKVDSSNYLPLW